MKFVFLLAVFFYSAFSFAQELSESSARIYFFNSEMRYEQNFDQEIVDRKPLNYALEYKKKNLGFILEYSQFEDTSGNLTSSFLRHHQDILVWLKYYFYGLGQENTKLNLFAGPGVGGYKESLTSTFMGSSRTDHGGFKESAGLLIGAELAYKFTERWGALIAVEGRALTAQDYEPNPLWSGTLRLGLEISF